MPNVPDPNAPSKLGSSDKPNLPDQDTLKKDAGALVDEAKSVGGKIVEEAQDQVTQLADAAKAQMTDATDKVKGVANEQKELLAAQIGGVADAMVRVADDLERNNGASAHYARSIADNAEKLSATLRDKDVDEILEVAQDFGRKQPLAFIGAAALLGFAASRFLLASAKRREGATTFSDSEDASEEPVKPSGVSSSAYQPNPNAGGV